MNNVAKHAKAIVSKAFPPCEHDLLPDSFFLPPAECSFKTLWLDPRFAHGTGAALQRTMRI